MIIVSRLPDNSILRSCFSGYSRFKGLNDLGNKHFASVGIPFSTFTNFKQEMHMVRHDYRIQNINRIILGNADLFANVEWCIHFNHIVSELLGFGTHAMRALRGIK